MTIDMKKGLPLALLTLLSACAQTNPATQSLLTASGVSADKATSIVNTANQLGQLACEVDGVWAQVAGVNVIGASAASVKKICDVAAPQIMTGSTAASPGALPADIVPKVVAVDNAALATFTLAKAAGLLK